MLTSIPNNYTDVVVSLMHDPLPKRYIDRARVQMLKFILPPIVPRNSGGLIELFTKILTHEDNPPYSKPFYQFSTRDVTHVRKYTRPSSTFLYCKRRKAGRGLERGYIYPTVHFLQQERNVRLLINVSIPERLQTNCRIDLCFIKIPVLETLPFRNPVQIWAERRKTP